MPLTFSPQADYRFLWSIWLRSSQMQKSISHPEGEPAEQLEPSRTIADRKPIIRLCHANNTAGERVASIFLFQRG
jgi:hypothetical protein